MDAPTPRPAILADCPWCDGTGATCDDLGNADVCGVCDGGKFAPIVGRLAATKSYPTGRGFRFNPGTGQLVVTRNRRAEVYSFREFDPDRFPDDPPLRGFACGKASTGELYHLLCGPAGVISCDCAAAAWAASARCNQRARLAGDPEHLTAGCVHSDFVEVAIREGLFPARTSDAASDR